MYIKHINNSKKVAFVGVMAAIIEAGKLILASIPNVEVVTLLCALYGYCFGLLGLEAVYIFIIIETFVWGISTWVISYLIYWPLVCIVFMLLRKTKMDNRLLYALIACALTFFFGILTSLVDIGLFSGHFDNFFKRFMIYYLRGIWFYVVHIICNAVLFVTVFKNIKNRICKFVM
ncbi:MAG: hypothetical protein K6G26_05370 [Lachnospiraceae bacterium]|nr:hypothetical protein [Lachnospiraceae bacterium]